MRRLVFLLILVAPAAMAEGWVCKVPGSSAELRLWVSGDASVAEVMRDGEKLDAEYSLNGFTKVWTMGRHKIRLRPDGWAGYYDYSNAASVQASSFYRCESLAPPPVIAKSVSESPAGE